MIKSGSVAKENKSYFCPSEPYGVNADPARFAMKNSVNDNSNKVHGPFGLSVSESFVVIWYQSVAPQKKLLRPRSFAGNAEVLELDLGGKRRLPLASGWRDPGPA